MVLAIYNASMLFQNQNIKLLSPTPYLKDALNFMTIVIIGTNRIFITIKHPVEICTMIKYSSIY